MSELPVRKPTRIENFDYSTPGAYFITICTQDRKEILSKISVGTGILDCPHIHLLRTGEIADKYIRQMNAFYEELSVDTYVIMPDHIHMLITIHNGQSRTPVPTQNNKTNNPNATIPKFVSTFKRFCNKACGKNIWQGRYYDHVVRNQQDYNEIWEYIKTNPIKYINKKRNDP